MSMSMSVRAVRSGRRIQYVGAFTQSRGYRAGSVLGSLFFVKARLRQQSRFNHATISYSEGKGFWSPRSVSPRSLAIRWIVQYLLASPRRFDGGQDLPTRGNRSSTQMSVSNIVSYWWTDPRVFVNSVTVFFCRRASGPSYGAASCISCAAGSACRSHAIRTRLAAHAGAS